MDLTRGSTFWGRRLGEGSSVGEESDEEFRRESDFSVDYDSEEEQRHEMEESLYCQMYFKDNSVKSVENSEVECNYDVANLSSSDLVLAVHCKESKLSEDVKDTNSQRNEDCTDVTKTNKKRKKSIKLADTSEHSDEKLVPNKSSKSETVSSTNCVILDESFNFLQGVLVPAQSEKSEINSDDEPYLVEDEDELEDSAHKLAPEKCKRSRKTGAEVLYVSDTSSDSSLFLDISTDDDDDDIDVNMVKSHAACDEGENEEHLQAILNSLQAECDWKINNADRFGSSSGGEKSRYYNSASKFRCNNCNQRGHFTHACPEPRKVKACILCGNRGHLSRCCSQSLCFRCHRPGHAAKECDRKRMWHEDACHRCGIQGHVKSDCPDNWRQYHLTINSDIVKGPKLENHRKFCYNCAAGGHFGHECRRRMRDSYTQPSSPFIMKYGRKRDKRSQSKDTIVKNESLSASVTGRESFLVQHIESKHQKEGGKWPYRKRFKQTDMQFEGKIPQQSNEMNCDPLEFDRKKDAGKDNPSQWTNFARKIKDKLLDLKKSVKKSAKKPKKAKDVLQLNYLPLTTEVCGGEAYTYHSFQRSADCLSDMKSSSSNVCSLSKSVVSHTSMDGLYAGDFPRSNAKAWKNQGSVEFKRKKNKLSNCSDSRSDGCYSQQLQFTAPRELDTASKRFIDCRDLEWQQTSTPVGKMNGHQQRDLEFSTPSSMSGVIGHQRGRSHELCANDMLTLEGDEMLTAYYGKNQIRNSRRKERKKKRQAMLALDKSNSSVKSSGRKSRRKSGSGSSDRRIETERGFRIRVP